MTWSDALDGLNDAVHGSFGRPASYTPEGGAATDVSVVLVKETGGEDFGDIGVATARVRAEVRVSEIATAARGDVFTLGGETWKVTRADTDSAGLIWKLKVERTS